MTCDRLGLIGREMFAIDGVKLPAKAGKERSGTYAGFAFDDLLSIPHHRQLSFDVDRFWDHHL